LATPLSGQTPAQIEGATGAERYRYTLDQWKAATERQIASLQAADWDEFSEALAYKDELLAAWGREDVDLPTLQAASTATTREEWATLIRTIKQLDAEAQDMIQRVMAELRGSLRQFEFERRVMRSYQSLPDDVAPTYHDRKY
jgi:hypothetical protein